MNRVEVGPIRPVTRQQPVMADVSRCELSTAASLDRGPGRRSRNLLAFSTQSCGKREESLHGRLEPYAVADRNASSRADSAYAIAPDEAGS